MRRTYKDITYTLSRSTRKTVAVEDRRDTKAFGAIGVEAFCVAIQHGALRPLVGIADLDLQQEPVELRLR